MRLIWAFLLGCSFALAQAPAVCRVLVPDLTNNSADTRERAARAIYEECPPGMTAMLPNLNAALEKSIEMGNASAAALLLLGRYHDAGSRAFLEQRLFAKTPKVKLDPWQKPVATGLAAAVGAVSAGSERARARIKDGLGPIEEAEFLAATIPSLEDQPSLQILLKLLDDERTVNTGVPSGVEPKLRIVDLALESYVKRFGLQPFLLRPGDRYTAGEIAQVRKLIAEQR